MKTEEEIKQRINDLKERMKVYEQDITTWELSNYCECEKVALDWVLERQIEDMIMANKQKPRYSGRRNGGVKDPPTTPKPNIKIYGQRVKKKD